jgi:hypothetical protein
MKNSGTVHLSLPQLADKGTIQQNQSDESSARPADGINLHLKGSIQNGERF